MRSIADVLLSVSAVVFGVATWSVAHLLTFVLFAHTHTEPEPYTHVHEGVGSIFIATVTLLATSISASLVGSGRSPFATWAHRFQPGSLMAAFAPAAFVLIELGEHLASGNEGPPATLLIIGVAVHGAMGAVTPLLWSGFVRPTLIALLVDLVLRPSSIKSSGPVSAVDPSWASSPPLSPSSGRGPPSGRFVLTRTTLPA